MSKRICFITGRFGDVDGVSLEADKWVKVLKEEGHTLFYMGGEFSSELENSITIDGAGFKDAIALDICERAFNGPTDNQKLLDDIEERSEFLYAQIEKEIDDKKIDIIVPQNTQAIPMQIPLSVAIKKLVVRKKIATVCHNHDFFWERERFSKSHIPEILETTFPISHPRCRHAVINSAAQTSLKERRSIESVVVPNVMDFQEIFGKLDRYNLSLREDLGVGEDTVLFVQPTRIVQRKGIETALELIYRLDDVKAKLLITGYSGDEGDDYFDVLMKRVSQLNIENQVIWGSSKILHGRFYDRGEKKYNLSDAYAAADFVTHPSIYEGFGNAFLETILAKKPFLVNNYRPVFNDDILPLGFEGVIIEGNVLTERAVDQVRYILRNPRETKKMVEHNFELGTTNFSYQVLKKKITPLFDFGD